MSKHSGLLHVLDTQDPNLWCSSLSVERSVFASLDFALITEQHSDYRARLFVYCEGQEVVVHPVWLRSVSGLPFAKGAQNAVWDIVSPEFTGPLTQGFVTQATASGFRKCLAEYCHREGIVAEFAHLHPWNSSPDLLAKENVSLDREIVFVDLTLPEVQMWRDSFTHACRKNIKRALRENVRVFQATTPQDVEQFYKLYIQTMDRRRALASYYFPLSYFLAFFQQMPDNATFFLAEYKSQIIAATLYLHDDSDVYSYLGGADAAFQHVRPSNAVVYEAIRWAQHKGKKRLILAGGYEPDDGIFRFKASFSPLRAKFYVYKQIHLPDEYDALSRAWAAYHGSDANLTAYFPVYRSTPAQVRQEYLLGFPSR